MNLYPLSIVGAGMVTGVGLSGPQCCAAIRCGINNFRETRFIDSGGEWIVASEVPMDEPWRGGEKLARMLAMVLEESFQVDIASPPAQTPIIFCFAERERPGRVETLNESVLERAQQLLSFQISSSSMAISQGRVGCAVALREARKMIYERDVPAVVVAAADSYVSGTSLEAYDDRDRLLTDKNSNGFVPGEGASAIVVKRLSSDAPELILLGMGFGIETATIEGDEPLRGDGLVHAIRAALSDSGIEKDRLDFRIADVSGEQYWFKEASLAMTRILRTKKEEFDFWHPADCIGEVGSAVGPVALNVAWHAFENGYSKGDAVICHFGNDNGKRAALILTYRNL